MPDEDGLFAMDLVPARPSAGRRPGRPSAGGQVVPDVRSASDAADAAVAGRVAARGTSGPLRRRTLRRGPGGGDLRLGRGGAVGAGDGGEVGGRGGVPLPGGRDGPGLPVDLPVPAAPPGRPGRAAGPVPAPGPAPGHGEDGTGRAGRYET